MLEKISVFEIDKLQATQKAIKGLYQMHCEEAGKNQWINKTPMYLGVLPVLQKIFPDMKVINCVRDGRDVTWSIKDRPFGPNDPEKVPKWWATLAKAGRDFHSKFPNQYFEVKYEDMINNTQAVVSKCLNFLDLEDESKQIVEDYPVEIYGRRIGVYKDKPRISGFQNGEPKKMLEKLNYI